MPWISVTATGHAGHFLGSIRTPYMLNPGMIKGTASLAPSSLAVLVFPI